MKTRETNSNSKLITSFFDLITLGLFASQDLMLLYQKMKLLICYYYLLPWFSLKLELAGNNTILSGRSQLVCPYGRDPFIPDIFIDMALVLESFAALVPHVPFQVV